MSKDEVANMIFLKQKENKLTDEQAAKAAGINIETAKRLSAQDSIKKSIEKITSALAPVLAVIADGIAMITGNTGGLIATFGVLAFAYLPKIVKGAKAFAAPFKTTGKALKKLVQRDFKGFGKALTESSDKTKKLSSSLAGAPGKGIKMFFQNLASGLRSMGKGPVLKGVLALALFAPAALLATLAIPFLAFIAIPGVGAGISAGLIGIGSGLASLGAVAASGVAFLAPLLLLALGAAMIPFAFSLRLLTPLVEAFGNIFIGVFNALPPIIEAVAAGIATVFGGIGDLISTVVENIIKLVDTSVIMGLYTLAPAFLALAFALPAVAYGLTSFALSIGLLSILTGGSPFDMFSELAEYAPGIDLASNALSRMSIALGGLQMALAGIDTEKLSDVMNPGLGGVVLGLGTAAIQGVTDVVGSIAGVLGAGPEEDSNQAVVEELQQVKEILSQILGKEGSVKIDSTKAGTAFSMGTSRLQ